MDQIAKDKVQAGIPPSIKLFRRYLSHRNGVSYLSFYCRYCSAKIASKIMQEDGRTRFKTGTAPVTSSRRQEWHAPICFWQPFQLATRTTESSFRGDGEIEIRENRQEA